MAGKFPANGQSWDRVKAFMEEAKASDLPWYDPHMFRGGSYYGGTDVAEVANQAYQMYINTNALLGNMSFPSLARYETELIAAILEMMNAPQGAAGSTTAGGTESILMAVKTARDWARVKRPQTTRPEIIVPRAAHPAFDKSGYVMDIKTVRVERSIDYRADVEAMAAAINDNTIMIAASAPSYPYGVTDPVAEIAALAADRGLWCHVDACHGGYILPFARKLGYAVPDYDFDVPGVTSISIDVHKLGYSNKGVAALLFRDSALQQYQRFTFGDWPAGIYATANLTASRSGGGIASAWAVLHYLGEEGYLRIAREILETRGRLIAGINAIDGLEVLGRPDAYLIAFGSDHVDVAALDGAMTADGWLTKRNLDPPAIHLFVDLSHGPIVDEYVAALKDAVRRVRAGEVAAVGEAPVYAV